MKKKATTWRQHQKERQKKAACSEDVGAEEAIDYLEHLRAEHGCEATLTAISTGTQLISAVHTVAHGQEQPPNYTEQINLTENLLKVAEATSLHPAWQFIALFDAALEFTSKHEAQIRAVVEDKSRAAEDAKSAPVDKIKALQEREEAHGLLVIDKKLIPDPQLVAAVQQKYPAAEASRQRMYAQFLTGLKRETKTEAFSELEQMIPQSYVDNLLARIA